jgi:hypothetical protein
MDAAVCLHDEVQMTDDEYQRFRSGATISGFSPCAVYRLLVRTTLQRTVMSADLAGLVAPSLGLIGTELDPFARWRRFRGLICYRSGDDKCPLCDGHGVLAPVPNLLFELPCCERCAPKLVAWPVCLEWLNAWFAENQPKHVK